MLSIVVPAHLPNPANVSLFREAIKSLQDQTRGDFEVVCVLNGACIAADELGASTGHGLNIRWVEMQGKASAAAARNLGVREASGETIALLDADDLYHPRKIESQIAAFGDSGCDFLGTLYYYLRPDGTHVNSHYDERYCDPAEVKKIIKTKNVMCNGSVMFSRAAFESLGGYEESHKPRSVWPNYGRRMHEDWDLWIRAVEAGMAVGNLPERLYYYRFGTSVPV